MSMNPALILTSTAPCMVCGRTSSLRVPAAGLLIWQSGAQVIQEALPELTADEREMLMTGTHPDCWDAMFEDEDE